MREAGYRVAHLDFGRFRIKTCSIKWSFITACPSRFSDVRHLWWPTSRLVAHPMIFRLLMKGKFDAYVFWPLAKRVQKWIIARPTVRDYSVFYFFDTALRIMNFKNLACKKHILWLAAGLKILTQSLKYVTHYLRVTRWLRYLIPDSSFVLVITTLSISHRAGGRFENLGGGLGM